LSEKQVGTEPDTHRLEAFSAGVFAIAITILVLQVGVPEWPSGLSHDRVAAALTAKLLELWPGKLVSYALSFVIVGMFRVAHHMAFHHIRRSDRPLLWLNTLFLMCVSFIPFPTALLGRYFDQRIAVVVYAISLAATGLSLELLWRYAAGGRRLVGEAVTPGLVAGVSRKNLVGPALAAVAAALAFVSLRGAVAVLLLAPVQFALPARVPRRRRRGGRHPVAQPAPTDWAARQRAGSGVRLRRVHAGRPSSRRSARPTAATPSAAAPP
jgi:uncharacterized membrane protein